MSNQFSRRADRTPVAKAHDVLQAPRTQAKKLTVLMDPTLHKQLQVQAVTEDRTMTDIITTLVHDYVNATHPDENT